MLKDWGMDWRISLQDAVISNALLAGLCVVVSNILRFYRPQKQIHLYLLALSGAMTGLWGAVVKYGLGQLFIEHKEYTQFFDKSMPVRLDIAFLVSGCAAM